MQFANVLVVFEQLPAFVVVAQLTAPEGKREADRAGVVCRIHGGNDKIVTARRRAALHIGDKTRDGFCLQEHHHHGRENKIVLAVKAQVVQILNRGMQISDPFFRLDALDIVDAHRVLVPRGHIVPVGRKVQAVTAVAAAQIQRFTGLHNLRAVQHL